ncbi:phosphoric monoester hydrolase [Phakopsora pachyrhizi]|nr:phosphoric monoester hydrolase [Phakopsora pachyrhizi]
MVNYKPVESSHLLSHSKPQLKLNQPHRKSLQRPSSLLLLLLLILSSLYLYLISGTISSDEECDNSTVSSYLGSYLSLFSTSSSSDCEDYNRFVWNYDLPESGWSTSLSRRVIAIGDLHGSLDQLRTLLKDIHYDSDSDTVILIGDLMAKAPSIKSSLDTVSYCRSMNFTAVRGNHDQYVIRWRNWMELHRHRFINSSLSINTSNPHPLDQSFENDEWLKTQRPVRGLKLPNGLRWKDEHFEIARRLKISDHSWLLSLSLTIYSDFLKSFFVHAGLLPYNSAKDVSKDTRRSEQLILSLRENRDPYTLIEMRNVRSGRRPTKRTDKGKPWYKIWNRTMNSIKQQQLAESGEAMSGILTVIYGHWAAKGLKLNDYTIGLDSGCVYGRQLSALVINSSSSSSSSDLSQDDDEDGRVDGSKGKKSRAKKLTVNGFDARIVQVSC